MITLKENLLINLINNSPSPVYVVCSQWVTYDCVCWSLCERNHSNTQIIYFSTSSGRSSIYIPENDLSFSNPLGFDSGSAWNPIIQLNVYIWLKHGRRGLSLSLEKGESESIIPRVFLPALFLQSLMNSFARIFTGLLFVCYC